MPCMYWSLCWSVTENTRNAWRTDRDREGWRWKRGGDGGANDNTKLTNSHYSRTEFTDWNGHERLKHECRWEFYCISITTTVQHERDKCWTKRAWMNKTDLFLFLIQSKSWQKLKYTQMLLSLKVKPLPSKRCSSIVRRLHAPGCMKYLFTLIQ